MNGTIPLGRREVRIGPGGRVGRSGLGARRVGAASIAGLLAASIAGTPALAHSPNPLLGSTTWDLNESVGYQWALGAVPPAWMAAAIDAGAGDVGESRNSRAATFVRVNSSDSRIAYGGAVPCSSYGIACMNRTGVPVSFAGMWFRPYGWAFDWGSLRWCQGMATATNGCYDVENVALDEFGHIEIIGHHVNYADESDFTDSVVQFAARSRPKVGWNQHAFGPCDVATLQLQYALIASDDLVSTCLALATVLWVSASSTALTTGESVRFTGTLKVAPSSGAGDLSGDLLSARTITLQRRAVGGTTWSSISTLSANAGAGSYSVNIAPTATYDYRLVFAAPALEGLSASTSGAVRVSVSVSGGGCSVVAASGARFLPCE